MKYRSIQGLSEPKMFLKPYGNDDMIACIGDQNDDVGRHWDVELEFAGQDKPEAGTWDPDACGSVFPSARGKVIIGVRYRLRDNILNMIREAEQSEE